MTLHAAVRLELHLTMQKLAVAKLKNSKILGMDATPSESLKFGKEFLVTLIHKLVEKRATHCLSFFVQFNVLEKVVQQV